MFKFDKVLANVLSQVGDDRDGSILDLIELASGEEGEVPLKAGTVEKKQADE